MSSKQNDLTWQAMSHYYYDAVSQCIAQNIVAWNTSEADVKSGKFFRTNWGDGSSMGTAYGFIARDELGDVGDDGKEGCNAKDSELIKKALSHWGLSALEFGCSVLYDRSNGTDCMQGNGGFKVKSEIRTGLFSSMPNSAELSKNFQSYIKGKVFDGKDPTASTKQVQYIYFRQAFLKGCAYNASPLSQKPGGNNVYEIGEVNSSGDVGTVYYVGTESADKNRPIWSNQNREWSCGDIAKRIGPKGDLTTAYSAWYGYGKLMHSGYHFIDLLTSLEKINSSLTSKAPDTINIFSQAVRPIDQHTTIAAEQYANFFGNTTADKLETYMKLKPVQNYGEVDSFSQIQFTRKGKIITTAQLSLMQSGFSQRAWAALPEDTYKANGRVRHEFINIHIGPLCSIQVHSYQSTEIADQSEHLHEPGDKNHFDIYIFRNSNLIGGKSFERIPHIRGIVTTTACRASGVNCRM